MLSLFLLLPALAAVSAQVTYVSADGISVPGSLAAGGFNYYVANWSILLPSDSYEITMESSSGLPVTYALANFNISGGFPGPQSGVASTVVIAGSGELVIPPRTAMVWGCTVGSFCLIGITVQAVSPTYTRACSSGGYSTPDVRSPLDARG